MLEALLRLQSHDTTADQLRHRLETLPQRAQLAERATAASALEAKVNELGSERDQLAAAQRRLEDDAAMVVAKAGEENQRMYSGSVTAPRELQALQQEIDALGRRQRQLEDEEIVLMEKIEPIDAELEVLAAERDEIQASIDAIQRDLSESEQEIHAELEGVEAEIETERSATDPDLLVRYDSMRKQLGGIAIARLIGSTCGGCHLTLSAVELDKVRHEPPDALVLCEECGRILVR